MNGDERIPTTFSLARRWAAGLNLVITVIAVLAIVLMLNYLGTRHFGRLRASQSQTVELSQRTRAVLASLTNTVKVTTYFDADQKDSLFPRVRALLKEYETAAGNKVQVQHVDYVRQPAAATVVKAKYKLPDTLANKNLVIFEGNRTTMVLETELSDYDTSELMSGKSKDVYRTHFKGELLFTSKIYEATSTRSPKAYFMIGNGEHSPAGAAAAKPTMDGYSEFASVLKNENNFELQILSLVVEKEVPTDCSLLIVAGPTETLSLPELEAISRYLDRGGRLLVLFNFRSLENPRQTGLEKLLAANWGVEVDQNMIVDPENSTDPRGMDPIPVTTGSHPIVNSLGRSRLRFILPRAIHASRSSNSARRDQAKVDELLFTGPKTESLRSLKEQPKLVGPQPLAVAVEKSIPALERGSTRIVVLGDSSLWSNQYIGVDANRDFVPMVVNWLVQQNVLLGEIPRQALRTYKLGMSQTQLRSTRWLLLGAMPGAVLFIGFVVWFRRRS